MSYKKKRRTTNRVIWWGDTFFSRHQSSIRLNLRTLGLCPCHTSCFQLNFRCNKKKVLYIFLPYKNDWFYFSVKRLQTPNTPRLHQSGVSVAQLVSCPTDCRWLIALLIFLVAYPHFLVIFHHLRLYWQFFLFQISLRKKMTPQWVKCKLSLSLFLFCKQCRIIWWLLILKVLPPFLIHFPGSTTTTSLPLLRPFFLLLLLSGHLTALYASFSILLIILMYSF